MSKEDDEKLWNFVLYKCYMTDKEMEEAAPYMLGFLGIICLVGFIWWLIAK